ncbi:MAG: hypothetical protein Q4G02_02330 [bacterium]|nr:hypothetical protein [bacterium]
MKEIRFTFQIFVPGGNDTALVLDLHDRHQYRQINQKITGDYHNVEQVGFVNPDHAQPRLAMAGGEFCGNATRSAAWYYLNGQPGEIQIQVSGVSRLLKAGVTDALEAWAEMPVGQDLTGVSQPKPGHHLVKMEGITHLILEPEQAKPFLEAAASGSKLTNAAFELLEFYDLMKEPAAGVLFLEKLPTGWKMHPCVYVSANDQMYYETACGSGSVAVGLWQTAEKQTSQELAIAQPSGGVIKVLISYHDGQVTQARICGPITTDRKIYEEVVTDECSQ